MNMRLRQYFARVKPFRTKKIKKKQPAFDWLLLIFKKSQVSQKSLNFKIWLQKFQIGNHARETQPATAWDHHCEAGGAVASLGQVLDHRGWARKFVRSVLWFAWTSLRMIWFYLPCSWLISREHVRFPGKSFPVSTLFAALVTIKLHTLRVGYGGARRGYNALHSMRMEHECSVEEINRSFKRDYCLLTMRLIRRFYRIREFKEYLDKMNDLPKHHGEAQCSCIGLRPAPWNPMQ